MQDADLPATDPSVSDRVSAGNTSPLHRAAAPPPRIPDYQLLRCIGAGSYGEVWLARSVLGDYRAVKVVYRNKFDHDRPYEREFEGIKNYEPVSRTHDSQVDILHVGRNDEAGYFYYLMELADAASGERGEGGSGAEERRVPISSPVLPFSPAMFLTPSATISNSGAGSQLSNASKWASR